MCSIEVVSGSRTLRSGRTYYSETIVKQYTEERKAQRARIADYRRRALDDLWREDRPQWRVVFKRRHKRWIRKAARVGKEVFGAWERRERDKGWPRSYYWRKKREKMLELLKQEPDRFEEECWKNYKRLIKALKK